MVAFFFTDQSLLTVLIKSHYKILSNHLWRASFNVVTLDEMHQFSIFK